MTAPPCRGGATSIIFGTDFSVDVAEVHQRPGLEPDRLDPAPCSVVVGVERLAILIAGRADIGGREHDAGHAVVDQGAATPSISSTALPVGSSAPQLEPAVSRNSSGTGAAVPGTPSIRASPS